MSIWAGKSLAAFSSFHRWSSFGRRDDSAVPASRSSGVGSMIRTSHPSGSRLRSIEVGLAPDAQGVPETDRSYERVSNWKVHRTRGSPACGRRPTPCGSRARCGIITSTHPGRCSLQSHLLAVNQPQSWLTASTKLSTEHFLRIEGLLVSTFISDQPRSSRSFIARGDCVVAGETH